MFTTQQQPQSHVRNACDPCHRRKIRCIASSNGGPCHHCQSKGLSCYFLPRYRSGRPRLNLPPPSSAPIFNHDALVVTPPGSAVTSHASSSSTFDERRHRHDIANAPEHQQDYGLQDVIDQTLRSPSMTAEVLLDLQQHALFPDIAGSSGQHNSFADLSDHDRVFDTIPTPVSVTLPPSSWSTTPVQAPQDRGTSVQVKSKASQEDAFSDLLRQCSKLQRHLLVAEDLCDHTSEDSGAMPPHLRLEVPEPQLQEMLEDVEANCKQILEICEKNAASAKSSNRQPVTGSEVPPSQPLDAASISLITTIMLKAFQILNIILGIADPRARSMAKVLLYKRLDVNITLMRIVISKLETLALHRVVTWQELSKRAIHIERRFADERSKMESGSS